MKSKNRVRSTSAAKSAKQHVCWVAFSPEQIELIAERVRSSLASDIIGGGDFLHDTPKLLALWSTSDYVSYEIRHGVSFEAATAQMDEHNREAEVLRLLHEASRGRQWKPQPPADFARRLVAGMVQLRREMTERDQVVTLNHMEALIRCVMLAEGVAP